METAQGGHHSLISPPPPRREKNPEATPAQTIRLTHNLKTINQADTETKPCTERHSQFCRPNLTLEHNTGCVGCYSLSHMEQTHTVSTPHRQPQKQYWCCREEKEEEAREQIVPPKQNHCSSPVLLGKPATTTATVLHDERLG